MRWNNLGDIIDRSIDLDRPAIIDLAKDQPRLWTHAEVDALANGVARYLQGQGLARGSAVAIMTLNRAEYVVAYFGIMRAGYVAVPVNVKLPADTVSFILKDADVKFAFVDAGHRALVPGGLPFLDFDDEGPDSFRTRIVPGSFDTVIVGPDEVAQILYTSGSTGRPKGVLLSHGGQLWALEIRSRGGHPDDRYIVAQPLFHMNGIFGVKTTFASTSSTVMLPKFDTLNYVAAIDRYQVTDIIAVPTMFARIIREPKLFDRFDLSHVRKVMLGSAPMTEALLDKIRARFPSAFMANGYGTTEAGPAIFGPHPDGIPVPPLSIGYPLDPSQVKLADGSSDDTGVLMMRNPSVMRGYQNLPEQTAKVIQDGWYYSGDLVRRDADGFYFFVGRADDMFVCSGENIYPIEVEKMLERHPSIQQAAVVPIPDEERGAIPVAFLVPANGEIPSFDEVKRFALSSGPAYQYPRRVTFVSEIPLAATNKVDRRALIAQADNLERSGGWSH